MRRLLLCCLVLGAACGGGGEPKIVAVTSPPTTATAAPQVTGPPTTSPPTVVPPPPALTGRPSDRTRPYLDWLTQFRGDASQVQQLIDRACTDERFFRVVWTTAEDRRLFGDVFLLSVACPDRVWRELYPRPLSPTPTTTTVAP